MKEPVSLGVESRVISTSIGISMYPATAATRTL